MENYHFSWENHLEMAIFNSKSCSFTRGCAPKTLPHGAAPRGAWNMAGCGIHFYRSVERKENDDIQESGQINQHTYIYNM